ncbi:hypothetical protein DFP73DRAFT_601221 [Morchella snyderi]|nr:hypothetical protein DFP73DRAFT_601221 [Morchella snyderi]
MPMLDFMANNEASWLSTSAEYGNKHLIEFDWETKTMRNITGGPAKTKDNGLVYVPVHVGSHGILVVISGLSQTFSEIRVFDIASSTWYIQTANAASGTDGMPPERVQACAVVIPAADNSSYNIYMFGGSTNNLKAGSFNDMWVLSLPSFKLIKIKANEQSEST